MKAVLQRVSQASVTVDGKVVGKIGRGLCVLLGVAREDTEEDIDILVRKIPKFRIFCDEEGKMNFSLTDVGGSLLVVSQFTLFGSWRKGNRPGFTDAAPPDKGEEYYKRFIQRMREQGIPTETGAFGAMMKIDLANEGPVTFMLDTKS